MDNILKSIKIYTDGAYSPLRNQGGIGLVYIINENKIFKYSKMYSTNSNNKMELLAVILALNSISKNVEEITIYSDSQYVIGTINNNWRRTKNKILWNLFDKAYIKASSLSNNIKFEWIKGHSDNIYNNMADKLANLASQEIK